MNSIDGQLDVKIKIFGLHKMLWQNLFDTTKQNINLHIENMFEEFEEVDEKFTL